MPGFGASPPLPDDAAPTPQALAAGIGRFMDGLGMERAHMVGNSLGGWVALELAKTRRALSVTGLSSAGFWGRPLGDAWRTRPTNARPPAFARVVRVRADAQAPATAAAWDRRPS